MRLSQGARSSATLLPPPSPLRACIPIVTKMTGPLTTHSSLPGMLCKSGSGRCRTRRGASHVGFAAAAAGAPQTTAPGRIPAVVSGVSGCRSPAVGGRKAHAHAAPCEGLCSIHPTHASQRAARLACGAAAAVGVGALDHPEIAWDLDVAVAGGGLAGLAVANALLRVLPDLKIKVFETSPAYTALGAGVMFSPNGLLALEAIDPTIVHGLYEAGTASSGMVLHDDRTGEERPWKYSLDPRVMMGPNGPPLPPWLLQWNDVRQVLYRTLPKEGVVEFACQVAACEEEPEPAAGAGSAAAAGGLTPRILRVIRNRGGPEETTALARAKWVIGADGFFSRVRRTAINPKGTPTFNERVNWRGSLGPQELVEGDDSSRKLPAFLARPNALMEAHVFHHPDAHKLPSPLFLTVPAGASGRMCWSLSCDAALVQELGMEAVHTREERNALDVSETGAIHVNSALRGREAQERALRVLNGRAEDLVQLVCSTPPETVSEHGQYVHKPDTYVPGAWTQGNVVLVGDAAHTTPGDGQGANLAMEDAVVLAHCVREHGLGPKAFNAYEAHQMPRCEAILWDKDPGTRWRVIMSTSFEPLWQPQQLPAQPPCASVEEAHAWSRATARQIIERRLEGRIFLKSNPNPDPQAWTLR